MNHPSGARVSSIYDDEWVARDYLLVILDESREEPLGFDLSSARLSLGAGEDDDIYLADVGVVPGHVEMIFLDGHITLLSAAEAIWIDGQPVARFPCEWPPLSVMSFSAGTHLAYGASDSIWPAVPDITGAEPEADDNAGWDDDADPEEFENDSSGGDHADFHLPLLSPRAQAIHSARLAGWALGAATVIVIAFVFADLLWGSREVIHPSAAAIDDSAAALNNLIASDPVSYRSVKLTERPDGALALTGFIESDEAYANLAAQVRQEDVNSRGNVRLDALTSSLLLALVEDQLAGYPLIPALKVSADEVRLSVVGLAIDVERTERIRDRLKRLAARVAPRTFSVDMQLSKPEQVIAEVERELSLGPTTRALGFRIDDAGGVIYGAVAASVEAETRQDLETIIKQFEGTLRLQTDLQVNEKINFNVVSLSQGGQLSLATMAQYGSTQTFAPGEAVFGVAKLLEVKGDGVALIMGRREIFLPLVM